MKWVVDVMELLPAGQVLTVPQASERGETEVSAQAIFLRVHVELPSEVEPGLVLEDGSCVLAYLNVCPHMGCSLVRGEWASLLSYAPGAREITVGPCPCHGSVFDLAREGLMVEGPATDHLPRLKVVLDGTLLTATIEDRQRDPRTESQL